MVTNNRPIHETEPTTIRLKKSDKKLLHKLSIENNRSLARECGTIIEEYLISYRTTKTNEIGFQPKKTNAKKI